MIGRERRPREPLPRAENAGAWHDPSRGFDVSVEPFPPRRARLSHGLHRSAARRARPRPGAFTVTTTADGGAGSLRAAMEAANATNGGGTIRFDIPWSRPPHPIRPVTDLPRMTQAITIDGYTQPGASPNTLRPVGSNAVLEIEVFGDRPSTPTASWRRSTTAPCGGSPSGASAAPASPSRRVLRRHGRPHQEPFSEPDPRARSRAPNGSSGSYAVLLGTGGGHVVGGLSPAAATSSRGTPGSASG